MNLIVLALTASFAKAPRHVPTTLFVADAPLPVDTGETAPASVACPTVWTITPGANQVAIDDSCPEAHRGAVQEAAQRWVFGAVEASPGLAQVSVRRTFLREAVDGAAPTWSAVTRVASDNPVIPKGCVTPKRRVLPELSELNKSGSFSDACVAHFRFRADGQVDQVEVEGCGHEVGGLVAESMAQWRFKICEDAKPEDVLWKLNVKLEVIR